MNEKTLIEQYNELQNNYKNLQQENAVILKQNEHLQENLKFLSDMLPNQKEGIAVIDFSGRFKLINPAMNSIFDVIDDSLISRNLFDFIDNDKIVKQLKQIINEKYIYTYSIDAIITTAKYYEKWINISITFDFSSKRFPDTFLCYIMDITKLKRTELQIQNKNSELKKYFTAIEQNYVSIVLTDLDANIIYANPQFEKATGYSLLEVLGQNPRILKSNKNPAEIYKELWDTLPKGEVWQGEFINLKKDGSEYIEKAVITPIKNDVGEVINYIAIKEDITELKRYQAALQLSEEKYRNIAENTKDVIWIMDLIDYKYLYISPSIQSMRGFTVEEFLSMEYKDTMMKDTYNKIHKQIDINIEKAKKTNKSFSFLMQYQQFCKNGKIIHVESTATFIKDINGIPYKLIGVTRDITERINYENELKNAKLELEIQLNEKDKFFSILAHDLRNPFTGVLGLASLLADKNEFLEREDIKDISTTLYKGATQLHALLENLLEWAKLKTNNFDLSLMKYDLIPIINNSIDLLQETATNKQINIITNYKHDYTVFVDNYSLSMILKNLISNAIKYSYPNDSIYIDINEYNEDYVIISIKDNGIGMSKEDISKLFKLDIKFSNPGTQKENGSGLGLLLCKEYLSKLGGEIFVDSKLDVYSVFSFTIPKYTDQEFNCIIV